MQLPVPEHTDQPNEPTADDIEQLEKQVPLHALIETRCKVRALQGALETDFCSQCQVCELTREVEEDKREALMRTHQFSQKLLTRKREDVAEPAIAEQDKNTGNYEPALAPEPSELQDVLACALTKMPMLR